MSEENRPGGENTPGSRQAVYPLSPSQERFWLLDQVDPDHAGNRAKPALRLRGSLDVGCLTRALQRIVDRHDVLRTTFEVIDGNVRQVVHPACEVRLATRDLTHLGAAEREAEVRRQLRTLPRQRFDLEREAGLRATLFHLGSEDHVLLVAVHHIVMDGISNGLFLRELVSLYSGFVRGLDDPLPPLPIQYGEYATRFRERLLQGELEGQAAYWRERLRDVPPSIGLVTDRQRGTMPRRRGAHVDLLVDGTLLQGIQRLRSEERVSVADVVLAAWNVLLHHYTGVTDIPIGMATGGRTVPELDPLLGVFINTVILRSDLSENPSFRSFLGCFHRLAREAYRNTEVPFEMVMDRLDSSSRPVRGLFPEVLCTVVDVSRADLKAPSLEIERLDTPPLDPHFDLVFFVYKHSEWLRVTFLYDTGLFDGPTIERMARNFRRLLECLLGDPDRPIDDHETLSDEERRQVLVDWNATKSPYPREKTVHALFEAQAQRTPQAEAVACGDRSLTYRELNSRADQLARRLRDRGVGPDVPVGICVERSLEMVVGLLGILKAGGAYVPLDPDYPQERLAFMVRDTGIPLLVTQRQLANALPAAVPELVYLDADEEGLDGGSTETLDAGATAESLAYVIYTSGSTGTPKGVEVLHRGVARLVMNTSFAKLDESERFLQLAPLSFDASTFEVWAPLLNGGTCVVFPPEVATPEKLAEVLRRQHVSTLWLTASLFNAIIDEAPETLRGVSQLLIGGEQLSTPHVRRAQAQLPGTQIINGYGPTESTTFTCCYAIPQDPPPDTRLPIGRPIANTCVYILNRQGKPVPIGVAGELFIGGDGLARGYLNRPELTAEKFIPDPFRDEAGARLYRTGDLVRYRPDGNIEFLGRRDDQVKLRGFRIELGEIESVIRQHEAVSESVVTLHELQPGDKRIVAYIVPRDALEGAASPASADADSVVPGLREHIRRSLPDYMMPSAFVLLDALPLTANGKVDRRALPEPDYSRPELSHLYEAPRNDTERSLCAIWGELLGLARVGARANFFELGGNSLLATRVISRVRSQMGLEVPFRSFFARPTIAELADYLDGIVWGANAGRQSQEGDAPVTEKGQL